jgi:hypothetical protein
MATFFVVPVILYEELNVFPAIKRSGAVFKKTWGETFVGHFGFGLLFFLLGLVGLLFILLGLLAGGFIGLMVGLVLAFIWWVFVSCLAVATKGVMVAALYRYARTGKIAPAFKKYEHLFSSRS